MRSSSHVKGHRRGGVSTFLECFLLFILSFPQFQNPNQENVQTGINNWLSGMDSLFDMASTSVLGQAQPISDQNQASSPSNSQSEGSSFESGLFGAGQNLDIQSLLGFKDGQGLTVGLVLYSIEHTCCSMLMCMCVWGAKSNHIIRLHL